MATFDATPDLEKVAGTQSAAAEPSDAELCSVHSLSRAGKLKAWMIRSTAIEYRGIEPVKPEERTDKRYINILSFWVSMTLSVLPITFGMLGPLAYGLSLRDSSLVILFFSILTGLPCAYLVTLGPKTGMRQMSLARYSFGYYLVSIPILLNLATLVGYCIVDDVIGGEVLAAVAPEHVSWTVGIAVIGIVAFLISFLGYRILHYYERYAWMVALVCIIILIGSGGKHLHKQSTFPPAEAPAVVSFAGLMAGYYLPWAAIASDFSAYISPEAPPRRIFWYAYAGLIGPSILFLILGAAIGGAVPNVPSWADAYATGSTGEVLGAVLSPLGGFGKFILVVLSLTIIGNLSGTIYAVTLNFQALLPLFTRVPRVAYAAVTTIIIIPISVKAAESFFDNLENFVGVIGYWSASWCAVVLLEHFWFRKGNAASYAIAIWNDPKALSPGIAAIAAGSLSMALAIPSMAQVWYVGPIGLRAGDIGFEMAMAVTALLYVPFRYLEIKICGHL